MDSQELDGSWIEASWHLIKSHSSDRQRSPAARYTCVSSALEMFTAQLVRLELEGDQVRDSVDQEMRIMIDKLKATLNAGPSTG